MVDPKKTSIDAWAKVAKRADKLTEQFVQYGGSSDWLDSNNSLKASLDAFYRALEAAEVATEALGGDLL